MSDLRIIAVSFEGGFQPRHISHVWTAAGSLPVQRAVENLWARRCRYYVVLPNGRLDVGAVPKRGPNLLAALVGKRISGHLESPRGTDKDGLLTLPRLPSPTRPRRSQAAATTVSG
ncbi:MAG: hypothetical protein M3Z29_09440 [Pseudomonadota bacterium]|nr:hypothetical protein [Pseudomonadota bacterium]